MFGFGATKSLPLTVSCLIGDNGYSMVGMEGPTQLSFFTHRKFNGPTQEQFIKAISEDVEKHRLYGTSCQLVLAPNLYQLVLMDALEVDEHEMAKAVRWQLKGLIEYPLNDIAVDAFSVPPHGAGNKRNKVFAAVTLQSALLQRMELFEQALLNVSAVTIAEMCLGRLLEEFPNHQDIPVIVISYDNDICHLYVYVNGDLYLFRSLPTNQSIMYPDSPAKSEMLLEIQRSIDYCLMELKLTEPKSIFFTPSFYQATDLFEFLKNDMGKDVRLLDVNSFLTVGTIAPDEIAEAFYAIGGALLSLDTKGGT